MTEQTPHWLLATDLDGTLLDEEYDYEAAASVIDSVTAAHDLIVVLASSKTLPEMLALADRCQSMPLLVFENGAGMAWHAEQLPLTGDFELGGFQVSSRTSVDGGYEVLLALLQSWRNDFGLRFTGFGDSTNAEIAALTGLTPEDAGLAKQRLFTEPLVWQDSPEQRTLFQQLLMERDLQLVAGGRFLHVMPHGDKAATVSQLHGRLQEHTGATLTVLACGDAENDLGMLEQSDIALVFPDSAGDYLLPHSQFVHHATHAGPAGWQMGVDAAIQKYLTTSLRTQHHE